LAGGLNHLLSCLVYVIDEIQNWSTVEPICRQQLFSSGGVTPGAIDKSKRELHTLYDGYEDEETWREMTKSERNKQCYMPLLFVSVPEMPVGTQAEVEAIGCTKRASSCLGWNSSTYSFQV
jgi:hypothetical protein